MRGDRQLSDPRLSPILADLSCLIQGKIKVDGVIALHDVLSPYAIEFVHKLADCGVIGEWLEWETQMHCFLLPFSQYVREAVAGKDWILDVIRRRAQRQ
jgi:acetyl esterase/lipase